MQTLLHWFRWLFTATLPAGRVLGIPLRVHVFMVIVAPLFARPFYNAAVAGNLGGGMAILFAFTYVAVLYLSIVAHEFGHAWGNRLVGGQTEEVLIWPLGGMAIGSGSSLSPRTELIVVALGPAVSVLLAIIGFTFVQLVSLPEYGWQWWLFMIMWMTGQVNMLLAVFNLFCPLFPMDSAKLIRATLSLKRNPQLVTLRVCQFGIGIGVFLLIGFFVQFELPFLGPIGIWMVLIGLFGVASCLQEMHRIKHMDVYAKSDNWGTRTVFYDQDEMARAKARVFEDLGGLFRRKPGPARKRPRRSGPAMIIDVASMQEPEKISDLGRLQQMMKQAADEEDFEMASRIKKRIEELRTKADDNSLDRL